MSLIGDHARVFFNPSNESCLIDNDTALGHDLFKISVRDTKANIEIDRVQDHRFRVVGAFETDQLLNPDIGSRKRTIWTRL